MTIIHASIADEAEKIIRVLAQSEKRSVSAMIRILLDEAIEQRAQKDGQGA